MQSLPQFQSDDRNFQMMQNRWASILNPVIANPINSSILLQNVILASGSNIINHRLGRKLTGWVITRIRASATIYDTQDASTMPDLTLTLVASGAVTVDILVF